MTPKQHKAKREEAQKHDSDFMNGTPFDIGDGYSVAFHSSKCDYCELMKRRKKLANLKKNPTRPAWL